jgi:general secretion pathway protein A
MHVIEELTANLFLAHWGFSSLPFPKLVRPEEAFLARQLETALSLLQQLLATREIGVVVGEAGTGKTTLLDLFLTKISVTRYRVIHLPFPQAKIRELYRAIATELGANPSWFGADAFKVVNLLTHSYLESNRPNLLMIDEAHLLSPACLNELRLLTNTQVKHEPLVTLILFGQPALASTLKLPALIPLVQRIGAWIALEGMGEEETINYIDWQVQKAGGKTEIFPLATKKALFRRSQGVPRLVNRLAWECLNQGCLDGAQVITEELFAQVCKTLGPHLAN